MNNSEVEVVIYVVEVYVIAFSAHKVRIAWVYIFLYHGIDKKEVQARLKLYEDSVYLGI